MSGARAHHFRTAIDEQHEFLARIWRDACLVVLGTTGFIAAMIFALHLDWWAHPVDWDLYVSAAQRWLAGGSYFQARQLSGPYQMQWGDILYPPTALWVFVPLSFVPRIACLLLPVPVIVAALYRLRPALWAWALMGVLFVYDPLAVSDLTGDPLLWLWAALFAAVAFGTPASFLLLKPTLLPFALFGIRRRSWWLGLGLLALLSLPMLALDLTWVRVVLDARQPFGVFYSVHQWPCMAIPLVAWAGSVRRSMRGMAPHLGIPRGAVRWGRHGPDLEPWRRAGWRLKPYMSFEVLLLTACWFDDPRGDDLRLSPLNSKTFDGVMVDGYWSPIGLTEADRTADS